jgi:hypothetical protein
MLPQLGKRGCRRQAMVAVDPALDMLAAPFPSHGNLRLALPATGVLSQGGDNAAGAARLAARQARLGA